MTINRQCNRVQNIYGANTIRGWDGSVNEDNAKGEERVNHRTSGNKSFQAESSWRLNESAEEKVTIEMGSLFQGRLSFERVISQSWVHWRNNEEAEVQVQSPSEHFICGYEVLVRKH